MNLNKVNRIIFGTASLGSKSNYSQSIKILDHVYSIGIKNFDSGALYGACQAHQIINDFSKDKTDINVSNKFLSKIYNPIRDLSKLAFVGSGINAYRNWWYSNRLYKIYNQKLGNGRY